MKNIFLIGVLVLSSFLFINCKDSNSKQVNLTKKVTFTKQGELTLQKGATDSIIAKLNIEIADNDYKTQTGLMYRSSMEKDQAMLFVFPNEQRRSFFMKNTEFSIDIIYFDSNKRLINFHSNAKPFDETSLPSTAPAKYVLEVNAGLAEQWNLEPGDTFSFTKD